MLKLRQIKMSRFRGARFELPLDFSKKHKSVAIFGENASGKSTITDALEWFIHDRVDHLWREDCKQESLRNVLSDDQPSIVELTFDGSEQSGTKTLSAELKTTTTYANNKVGQLVADLKHDNIILRHADIVSFLDKNKGPKREAIADIIGYSEITKFRNTLLQTKNQLEKDSAYTTAKHQVQHLQSGMIEETGQVVPTRQELYKVAKTIIQPFDLKTQIIDQKSFTEALEELREQGSSEEKIRLAERLAQLEKACAGLAFDLDQLGKDSNAFTDNYNALVQETENVNKLRLSDFLTRGKAVLNDGAFTDPQCPFCLKPNELTQLQDEVSKRLEALEALQKQLDAAGQLKEALLETVTNAGLKTKSLIEADSDLEGFSQLIAAAKTALSQLWAFLIALKIAFETKTVFNAPAEFDGVLKALHSAATKAATLANETAKNLQLTKLEKAVAATLAKLKSVSDQVKNYEHYKKIESAYETQIMTLSTMLEAFIQVQNTALQSVLDTISDDVGQFYKALHPNESVDQVRLTMVGEEGVEFQYGFSRDTDPPATQVFE